MYTRQQYMNREVTHEQYYGQFVYSNVKSMVGRTIGEDRIVASLDPHFSDIPLHEWDRMHPLISALIGRLIADANGGGISLCDTVCVAKEAARQIREEAGQ